MALPTNMTSDEKKQAQEAREAAALGDLAEAEPELASFVHKHVPNQYKRRIAEVLMGKLSAKQAIKMKCLECCGYENVAENVGKCTVRHCPLWCHRPYQ